MRLSEVDDKYLQTNENNHEYRPPPYNPNYGTYDEGLQPGAATNNYETYQL